MPTLLPGGGLVIGIITIAAGIVVLAWPRILAYIVGLIWLIGAF